MTQQKSHTLMTYRTPIRVTQDVQVTGALMPAKNTEGIVINATNPEKIVCQFKTPYALAGGGTALYDDDNPRGNGVYFRSNEIEVTE